MPNLLDPVLAQTLENDRQRLAKTEIPIITVCGTFREDLKRLYGFANNNDLPDTIFSRAHFSMAIAVARKIWGTELDPAKTWFADPTNYVTPDQWKKVLLTENIGKTLARQPLLKSLKDLVDKFGRSKMPILDSITPPLLHLTEAVTKPILCFHIAAGNILATQGKQVIQVVTDPHVRDEYVLQAARPNILFAVFDEPTWLEFMEVAAIHHIAVDPQRVIVTGPPIDERITQARRKKAAWRSGPLNLCLATGGLGTNKYEIRKILLQLLPKLRQQPSPYNLAVYAGTQADVAQMVRELARQEHVHIGETNDMKSKLRLIYHPQILDANEMLIHHAFPWADGFITKPSGDMAYDAVAAGCFLLTLSEWGIWEERIREIFEQKEISRAAEVDHFVEQLGVLQASYQGSSWVEHAMNHAHSIEKSFLNGTDNIIDVAKHSPKLFGSSR